MVPGTTNKSYPKPQTPSTSTKLIRVALLKLALRIIALGRLNITLRSLKAHKCFCLHAAMKDSLLEILHEFPVVIIHSKEVDSSTQISGSNPT
jgi:hypothetical protein